MNLTLALKLGQVAGALFLAAGVASCSLKSDPGWLFLIGTFLYAGCRLAVWLGKKE